MSEQETNFGFQRVQEDAKEGLVKEVFSDVATKYDIMNDIMSLGVHRLWKRYAIILAAPRATDTVLDLASGTGDLAALLTKKVTQGTVVLSDINYEMLSVGRDRLIDANLICNTEYALANAEKLPFSDNTFNLVTIAFGLRNVTHKDKALREIYRVLKVGGRVMILEFSHPHACIKGLYEAYSFNLIPKFGELITGKPEHYQYLVESIKMHPNQEDLKTLMEQQGFEQVSFTNLSAGIVAIHRGYKI